MLKVSIPSFQFSPISSSQFLLPAAFAFVRNHSLNWRAPPKHVFSEVLEKLRVCGKRAECLMMQPHSPFDVLWEVLMEVAQTSLCSYR